MLCKLADRFHYPVYARNLGCGVMSLDVEPSDTVAKGVPHGMIHAIIHFNSEHPFKVFTKATSYGRTGELDGLRQSPEVSTRELAVIEQALKDYPEDGVDDIYAALGLKAPDAEKSVTYGSTSQVTDEDLEMAIFYDIPEEIIECRMSRPIETI